MNHLFNSIKGSRNVITGCGTGLGRATMKWFIEHGSGPILAIDRKFEDNYQDELGLAEEQMRKLTFKQHDTFDEKVESSMEEFVSNHGPIDNLINVAGVALSFTLITTNEDPTKAKSYDLKHARDLYNFNTAGTFNMIRLASRFMIDHAITNKEARDKPKCIINTSCVSTTKPSLGQTFYVASKASIDSMTLSIARELSSFNIRCNTINVGYFDTKLLRANDERVVSLIQDEIALCPARIGHPDEFAHLAQAIVENQMINGACIKIDACADSVHPRTGKPKYPDNVIDLLQHA